MSDTCMGFMAVFLFFMENENIKTRAFAENCTFASKFEYHFMKKKSWFAFGVALGQLCFFILFVWYFHTHSFLRPYATATVELMLALMLVLAMALNFWFLYPTFHPHKRIFYYTLCLLMVVATVVIEYLSTKKYTFAIYPPDFLTKEGDSIRKSLIFNLFLRNGGLVVFSGLMAKLAGLKVTLEERDRIILQEGKIHAYSANHKTSTYLEICDICYIKQKGNYSLLFTTDGRRYSKRGTLKDMESLLEAWAFVKVSKSILVNPANIAGVNGDVLVFDVENGECIGPVVVTMSYATTAIPAIERYLDTKGTVEDESGQKGSLATLENSPRQLEGSSEKDSLNLRDGIMKESKARTIYEYVSSHNNCKLNDIVTETNIPKSTVTRYLRGMQENCLVEYVGSKKIGGYRAVAKKQDDINA